MSNATDAEKSKSAHAVRGGGQLLVDLGPVLVFVLSYNILQRSMGEDAIFWATGLFMGAVALAIGYSWVRTKHIPPVLIITGILVLIFGGLTIALQDQGFIIMKPIFVYLLYAGGILGSQLFGLNLWKLLLGHAMTLPDRIWNILALRWGAFFAFMAALSAYFYFSVEFWGTMTRDFWVNSRLFIIYPLIFAFTLLNIPIIMKFLGKEDEGDAARGDEPAA